MRHITFNIWPGTVTKRHIIIAIVWVLIDSAVILVSYTIAYAMRALTTPLDYTDDLAFIVFAIIATVFSAYVAGVYHQLWRQTSGQGVIFLAITSFIATIITVSVDLLMPSRPVPLSVVFMGNALTLVGMTIVRYRSRLIKGAQWRWKAVWDHEFPSNMVRVMIIGAGESGEAVARRLRNRNFAPNHEQEAYKVVGFIDDNPQKLGYHVEGAPVLGNRHDIPTLVEDRKIDLLIFAVHNIEGESFREIQNLCWDANVKVKMVPDTFGVLGKAQSTALSLRDVQPEDILGRSQISQHEAVDLLPVMGKVVLVTGAAGSIGSELSRQMATYEPQMLLILDNNESALHNLQVELKANHPDVTVRPVLADVTRPSMVRTVFEQYRPQVVYHAAAYKHVPMMEWYPNEAIRVNVGGTRIVAECARDYEAERFVLISTDKAVHPSSIMGASKRLCELIIHALSEQDGHNTLYSAVRFGNVLGSRGSVLPTFIKQLNNGGPITVTDKRMTRYFMSIPEAVNLVIHAACLTQGNDIFLLRMGETVRIWDIAERVIQMHGLRPTVDINIVEIGMRPGEKLHETLHNDDEIPVDTQHPSIFKLHGNYEQFDAWEFLNHLDRLMHVNLSDCEKPLDEIKSLLIFDRKLVQITQS